MLAARLFFLASDFNVRTCPGVHVRRFDTFLAIQITPSLKNGGFVAGNSYQEKPKMPLVRGLFEKRQSITVSWFKKRHGRMQAKPFCRLICQWRADAAMAFLDRTWCGHRRCCDLHRVAAW
jgi:hypothetical protein